MIHYFLPADQDDHMLAYLAVWGLPVAEWFRLRPYEEILERGGSGSMRFEPGTYILAALDQLTPAMRQLVADVHAQLAGREGFRFLNHPARTLRRFELMTELHRLGRNAFGAVRATGSLDGLRYPVFIRAERSHDGPLSPLLHSPWEVEAALGHVIVLRGRRPRDLLVVEFCPTADASGMYRKYAAFVVGDRILARSLEFGHQWVLKHDRSEFDWPIVEEEQRYVFENPHADMLAEIVQLAGVEYGRVDYALMDGQVQVWEINLHPAIGRRSLERPIPNVIPEELQPTRRQSQTRFYDAFHTALAAVDVRSGGSAVDVTLDPLAVRAARGNDVRRSRSARALVDLARPARPLLARVGAPLFPLLGRLVRRGADVRPSPLAGGSTASTGRTSTSSDRDRAARPPRAAR